MQWIWAHFLHRRECPKTSEILRDTISKLKYIFHYVSSRRYFSRVSGPSLRLRGKRIQRHPHKWKMINSVRYKGHFIIISVKNGKHLLHVPYLLSLKAFQNPSNPKAFQNPSSSTKQHAVFVTFSIVIPPSFLYSVAPLGCAILFTQRIRMALDWIHGVPTLQTSRLGVSFHVLKKRQQFFRLYLNHQIEVC